MNEKKVFINNNASHCQDVIINTIVENKNVSQNIIGALGIYTYKSDGKWTSLFIIFYQKIS